MADTDINIIEQQIANAESVIGHFLTSKKDIIDLTAQVHKALDLTPSDDTQKRDVLTAYQAQLQEMYAEHEQLAKNNLNPVLDKITEFKQAAGLGAFPIFMAAAVGVSVAGLLILLNGFLSKFKSTSAEVTQYIEQGFTPEQITQIKSGGVLFGLPYLLESLVPLALIGGVLWFMSNKRGK